MSEFLTCEIAEMNAVRAAVSYDIFIAWFEKSAIKQRFKKACMLNQRLRCCYCRRFNDTTNNLIWDLEHVLSERWYPHYFTEAGNLAVACKACNNAKSEQDVLQPQPRWAGMPLPRNSATYTIPHPTLDAWDDHLAQVNYQVYRSKSDKGLELISVCKLNKDAVEVAGYTYETLTAAIRVKYFESLGARPRTAFRSVADNSRRSVG